MRNRITGRGRVLLRALLAAVFMVTGFGLSAGSAQAGSWCVNPYCSETYNDSSVYADAYRNWCGDAEYLVQGDAPCGYKGDREYVRLNSRGSHTNGFEDWDTLKIDAGCEYILQYWYVTQPGEGFWGSQFSRSRHNSTTPGWQRVHNNQTLYVRAQYCDD
ncbi:hypothetical protein OG429_02335 [Streptomyces sp. NBC_00190]|uniref:hypothetical protein n=1 Tax=unclassified Streptomyces TaxID=2593676 RepID=UPI002E289536|nr:hypothetical protein [Streptomyces sp. NBC_00190]WSZ38257.1 hypothetical protein OG239_05330 [Streptomyces sp. NBC_00868]